MTLVRCVAARSQASRPASAACSELIAIAFIRNRFMGGKLANTIVQVVSAATSCSQSASGSAGSVQPESVRR